MKIDKIGLSSYCSNKNKLLEIMRSGLKDRYKDESGLFYSGNVNLIMRTDDTKLSKRIHTVSIIPLSHIKRRNDYTLESYRICYQGIYLDQNTLENSYFLYNYYFDNYKILKDYSDESNLYKI